MKLRYAHHFLEFKYPFGISSGSRTGTPVTFVSLASGGATGYGEASMPPYLGESHESVGSFLEKAKPVLQEFPGPFSLQDILTKVDAIEEKNTAAKAAIDIALHDLAGKLAGKPVHELLKTDKTKTPHSTYTIGLGDLHLLPQKILEAEGFPMLKIKLGSANDRQVITELRKHTQKPLAVDVNQGWKDKHFALDMIHWLSVRNVVFVEQPMPKTMTDEMGWLTERSPLPTIADESVQRLSDMWDLRGIFSGVNIKLMKCTGILEAMEMIAIAKADKLKILIGCMSETSCAVSAAAQISPLADWCDLDGPLLIKKDYFDGIKFVNGKIVLNDEAGIGAVPKEDLGLK
ncbi:MAG TPA: dipeptide epimerase [Bacteroidia bacterium]|jgi:L-alanine-DL-glutamate epimerase-like enolase superfamily enzyme